MSKTKSAKSMVFQREYRSKTVKAKRGRGSYRRYPRDRPSKSAIAGYIDLMNDIADTIPEDDRYETLAETYRTNIE